MANSGPEDNDRSMLLARNRQQQETKEARERRERLMEELQARLDVQQKIMGKYRSPDDTKVGGLVGKFCHLADLNAEQLAGQVIGQIMFDVLGLLCNREYRIDENIYKDATDSGIAYVGGEDQPIFKMDILGNLDFNDPYQEGEEIPLADIYRNGYIPPADKMAALSKHMNQSIQDYMGANSIRDDGLAMMFGANKAKEVRKQYSGATSHDKGSDLAAQGNLFKGPK